MLTVGFVDFWPGFDPLNSYFKKIQDLGYDLSLRTTGHFDYLIYSCFGGTHCRYANSVKIFFSGEDQAPDFNFCDYAMSCQYIEFEDRYFRLPLYALYEDNAAQVEARSIDDLKNILPLKKNFCDYIYSNPRASFEREGFFRELSNYKHVVSAGKHLNNTGQPLYDKFQLQRQSRFSIVFENASSSGYTTEKIVQAFAAGSIPIYWGNPRIADEFNPDSFVNCHLFSSFSDVVSHIKKIEENSFLYHEMLSQPPFLESSRPSRIAFRFQDFMSNIFAQPLAKSYRRSRAFFNASYGDRLFNQLSRARLSLFQRLLCK